MRRPVLLLLAFLSIPGAAAQSPEADLGPDPLLWDDYERAFAHFQLNVTNNGAQRDAFTISEMNVEPRPPQAGGFIYSPTPTLVLEAGATGTFHVWIGGWEQPPPQGPGAGDYLVSAKILSTVDPTRQATVQATLRRTHPQDPGLATLVGSVRDAETSQPPAPQGGPIVAMLGDPASVRVLPSVETTTNVRGDGTFELRVPAGTYWLRVEGPGYRTHYLGSLELKAGATTSALVPLARAPPPHVANQATVVGDAGLPTYRIGTSLDLRRVAVTPGFYTAQGNANERLTLFGSRAERLWQEDLPPRSAPPFDYGPWTSSDHGLDVSGGGGLIAIGTSGGTIEVYEDDGDRLWAYRGEDDVNPRVPGPMGRGVLRSSEVRFSLDADSLAAGTLTGNVHLFNATTGAKRWTFHTEGQVRALRFSPDAARLYVGSGDNRLYALDTRDGSELWRADLTFWPWEHIAMTPEANRIATGGKDGVLRVFDPNGTLVWSRQFPGFILGFDYDASGSQLFVLADNGLYSFQPDGRLRWYRHEIQNSGQLRVGHSGRYLGYGKASTGAAEPAARVLTIDGTPAWEFRTNQPETIYNVRIVEAPETDLGASRLVANGRQGKLYYFEGWQAATTHGVTDPTPTTTPADRTPAVGAALALGVLALAAARRRR